jgi:hypothetical protein
MLRIVNEQVEITFGNYQISGVLNGTYEGWGFYSHDPYFLELFPAGVLYSFSNYGPGILYSQFLFQETTAKKVKEVLVARCYLRITTP